MSSVEPIVIDVTMPVLFFLILQAAKVQRFRRKVLYERAGTENVQTSQAGEAWALRKIEATYLATELMLAELNAINGIIWLPFLIIQSSPGPPSNALVTYVLFSVLMLLISAIFSLRPRAVITAVVGEILLIYSLAFLSANYDPFPLDGTMIFDFGVGVVGLIILVIAFLQQMGRKALGKAWRDIRQMDLVGDGQGDSPSI